MEQDIRNKPDYASLHLVLDQGETIVTEAGAMMGMDTGIKMATNMKGGLLSAAKRAIGGESVFMNTYTATGAGQRLDLAPAAPGDVIHVTLGAGKDIIASRGAYLASTEDIDVSAKWGGAKAFFGGEGLFMLRCSGAGELWLSSYGAIRAVDVAGGYTVDTTHIVAFEDTLDYTIRSIGGMKSFLFSNEGVVCKFSGHGRLWIQTRSVENLAAFLHPFRRVRTSK